jgi:hypothetical protein
MLLLLLLHGSQPLAPLRQVHSLHTGAAEDAASLQLALKWNMRTSYCEVLNPAYQLWSAAAAAALLPAVLAVSVASYNTATVANS